MKLEDKPVGFFDSGVGGISVLREAVKLLPKENFVYFGDSENAPYGVKSVEEVRKLTFA
ncbi:MAG TPA: glutamate racemase, partial [Clostridiaceae bacterium]